MYAPRFIWGLPQHADVGQEIQRPVDLVTGSPVVEEDTVEDFAERLRSNMQLAHERARKCLDKSARRQERNYDRKATDHGLTTGHFAWLLNLAKKKHLSQNCN